MSENAVQLTKIIFRNAILEDHLFPADIAVRDGLIIQIGDGLPVDGAQIIDVGGMLASPLFVDPHHHLDCAYLIEPANQSGTLKEAIEINARVKATRTRDDILKKACQALEAALENGTGWIRSHTDIDPVAGLKLLEATVEARQRFRGRLDVQVVAFPQLGLATDPQAADWMRRAMQAGADIVGGMPHTEASHADAARHVELVFQIASQFDADIDMHVDETDDPNSRTLELVAAATLRWGYQGRVTASHCCALAAYPDEYASRVIDLVAEAQVNVVTNPLTNLYLQGRSDPQPVRRGITRVKELLAAGVNVACGSDDVNNVFFPYGRMDMLEVAMVTSLAAHLTSPEEIRTAFEMPRQRAAHCLRLEKYGLTPGNPADFVFLGATSPLEALRLQPTRRLVVRRGRVLSERQEMFSKEE